jgi:hypothetical protein
MLELLIGAFLGTLGSIGTAISIEWLRRPRLEFSIEDPPEDRGRIPTEPGVPVRFLRVMVLNRPLGYLFKWMLRVPALDCHATISFHHLDGKLVFPQPMVGRWAGSPEPAPIQIFTARGDELRMFDPVRLRTGSQIDIFPGRIEALDVAFRAGEEVDCYGWNNEAYFSIPQWRNPKWKLDRGRYLVKVVLRASGQEQISSFHLINEGQRRTFRLLPGSRQENYLLQHTK